MYSTKPCNERENIARVIPSVAEAMVGLVGWEIVVVDDGLRDRTWDLVEDIGRSNPNDLLMPHNRFISRSIYGCGTKVLGHRWLATLIVTPISEWGTKTYDQQ